MTLKEHRSQMATAVLLGMALMLTTFWLFPPEASNGGLPQYGFTPLAEELQRLKGSSQTVVSPPVDLTFVGFMLVLGIVCALGVTVYFKKRII